MIFKLRTVYLNVLLLPPPIIFRFEIFLVFVAIVVVIPSSNDCDLKNFYIKIM